MTLESTLLTSPDLSGIFLKALAPSDAVRLGRACRNAALAMRDPRWAAWWPHAVPILQELHALLPAGGSSQVWTWERKFLVFDERSPARELLRVVHVPFQFASDLLTEDAEARVARAANVLRRHPGLRIGVEGHARPGAPAIFGAPLSQARATRVRKQLLHHLRDEPAWADEVAATEADGHGVHPDGYAEGGADFEQMAAIYQPREVGRKILARGVWAERGAWAEESAQAFDASVSSDGQFARITLRGFED